MRAQLLCCLLRDLPAWGVFSWKEMPLQSLEGRAERERQILKSLKASTSH